MVKKISGVIILVSLLTGCSKSSGAYHDTPYYESHLAEASAVIKSCKAMDAEFTKTLRKDKNCRNAYFVELNAAFVKVNK